MNFIKEANVEVDGINYPLDAHGFMQNRLQWTTKIAEKLAQAEGVILNEEHWEVIQYFREYYEDYNIPPPMRMIVRVFRKHFGEKKANSRYLYSLFPEGPLKSASKYAGLPKPKNCK